MRVHFKIYSNKERVPFNHQSMLTGVIHKWIGWNLEHGGISLYSFSQLTGGKRAGNGLVFENGTSFFYSAVDLSLIGRLVKGVQSDPEMFCGLKVEEVIIQENPDLSGQELFYAASPIFIKRKVNDKIEHILYDDIRASQYLKETLETKLKKAGLTDETLDIRFLSTHPKAKSKVLYYDEIGNKASVCPVIIKGKPETKAFAWNAGLGNSTGIGFGAIK